MKKTYLFLILTTLFITACSNDDETTTSSKLNNPINDFTWKAMNSWYNWQQNVPDLADTKDDNKGDYHAYLNNFSSPEKLFESLIYQKGSVDRFSWFVEDYIEQEKQFQGISKTFGFTPKAVQISENKTVLVVARVSENSPASTKGLKRGDIIIGLNGQKFTSANFDTLIKEYYKESVEFMLGENDGLTEKSKVTMSRDEVSDHAIHLSKIFNDVAGKKVGYLVYNGFRSSYDKDLNSTFNKFKIAGINELILDLRYNGGGSVLTCAYLASLIYGEGSESDIFAKVNYNKKHPKNSYALPFLNGIFQYDANGKYIKGQDIPLNRLTGLSKIYVITSKNTASASEMIINGLRPYIEVITVGTKTSGKNVGSFTLYDSPTSNYRDKKTANKSHNFALQPITFQIFNKLDQSDYTQGFEPNIEVNEFQKWDDMLAFGDENEIMLKTVLNKIKGVSAKPIFSSSQDGILLDESINANSRFENEMYFESNFLNNLKQ